MCYECVHGAPKLRGVIPLYDYYVIAGTHVIVGCNDSEPLFTWTIDPVVDPGDESSNEEWDAFYAAFKHIESKLTFSALDGYRFVTACKNAGYDDGLLGAWLCDHIAQILNHTRALEPGRCQLDRYDWINNSEVRRVMLDQHNVTIEYFATSYVRPDTAPDVRVCIRFIDGEVKVTQ